FIDDAYQPCDEIKEWTKVANSISKQKTY
ncbi:MAG: hypothetical protein RIR55_284, partial [Bacteroidota bacterium]